MGTLGKSFFLRLQNICIDGKVNKCRGHKYYPNIDTQTLLHQQAYARRDYKEKREKNHHSI